METANKNDSANQPISSEPQKKRSIFDSNIVRLAIIALTVLGLVIGGYYWQTSSKKIYTDKAEIYAPLITLSPSQPGILQKIMVKNGDIVIANQALAMLEDNQYIRAKTDGTIVNTSDQIGKLFSPGTTIITMINPNSLRLIAHVAENKGLNDVRVGQKVEFTADTFGNKKFYGEVEEISQTSDQSSIVFSISDKRDEKYFSVKIKYNNYPQLLNGMSAKAWILK